jgi:copper resistance protein D
VEHSALHALQLLGLLLALGGPLLVTVFLPATTDAHASLGRVIERTAARWTARGTLLAALAAVLDLLVQAGELRGVTLFAGVDLPFVWGLATETTVGRLSLARITLLAVVALVVTCRLRGRWWWSGGLALGALLCTALVSHSAAQPTGRGAALVSHTLHLAAAVTWLGVLGHLLLCRQHIEAVSSPADARTLAGLIRRFSPVALAVALLLLGSGLYAVYRFLGSPAATFTSAYGLTLLVKLGLLVPLLVAARVNFRVIRPGLRVLADAERKDVSNRPLTLIRSPEEGEEKSGARVLLRRFGRMLELEVTAGVLVVTVAGIVASVSPPGGEGAYRLTAQQAIALLRPDLPTTALIDPAKFYGAETRTLDDLRYSEFTHNWSGIVVILLGACWLVQSAGRGAAATFAARAWPWLLLPFAVFVAVASDPEVWILREISLAEALRDPQILEHQLGALMVLLLVVLGWRARRRAPVTRPLGVALPAIMIVGSLLLLGHAHSTLTVTEELTNLINVQHAILGALGLFAGTVRWLQLRALLPDHAARWLWPALVIALGAFLAFFYREVV